MKKARQGGRFGAGLVMGLAVMAIGLTGCSTMRSAGVDPVQWYRDVSGDAANDSQDQAVANSQNLKEGDKEPYPNLASVPTPPETAMSRIDREKLAKGLVADRQNAEYTDQQLKPGQSLSAITPPPPASATAVAAVPTPAKKAKTAQAANPSARRLPKRGSTPPPVESSLRSPTIANLPQGEKAEAAPPPPPGVRHDEQLATAEPPRAEAVVPAGPTTGLIAEIRFSEAAPRGNILPADETQLASVARRALQDWARIRIIGHGDVGGPGDPAQREFQNFNAALDNAKAVAVALTRLGVPANRIYVETAVNVGRANRADIYFED